MTAPLTSILVLTWNSGAAALDAVQSALDQRGSDVEVVLLDNASSDGVPDLVERRFEARVRVVRFDTNHGYTGGYNRGIALSRGEFVMLLNPDARLDPEFLSHALPAFDDPRVGIVSAALMRPDGRTVDSSGQFLARSRRTIDRGYGERFDPARDAAGPVLSACGAAALYRRAMLDDIADADGVFLDADFFAFNEDLELGWRAWRAGWSAMHVPEAICHHERAGGRRAGRLGLAFRRSPPVIAHIVKNRWLAMLRHDRALAMLADSPWIAARDVAWLVALVFVRPGALRELWRRRSTVHRALVKRARDRSRRGRWGAWRREVPPRGVWRAGSRADSTAVAENAT